jgi:hypothetical protein
MCEGWSCFADNPFDIGERDLPNDIGWSDAFVGDGKIPAGAINLDSGAMLAAAVFELPAALVLEQFLDSRSVGACVDKEELGAGAAGRNFGVGRETIDDFPRNPEKFRRLDRGRCQGLFRKDGNRRR